MVRKKWDRNRDVLREQKGVLKSDNINFYGTKQRGCLFVEQHDNCAS